MPKKRATGFKTDRRSALDLALLLQSGDLTSVHVHGVEDEACGTGAGFGCGARLVKDAKLRLKAHCRAGQGLPDSSAHRDKAGPS
jgi:hypothetical protein